MSTLNLEYQIHGQGFGSDSHFDNASEALGSESTDAFGNQSQNSSYRASSIFSGSTGRPHDDLKNMLESNKDGLKLEAMKRLVAMIAKGRSSDAAARELFPSVVKNVVTKNPELKKLVYLYLTRYAEQEQDLALLSISSFQRSLKDPNPLIRGSALRVLSSIRVPLISQIMLIAIKDCASDMSPYVRKTAAHAIPKLYALDADLKDEIISIIERLLNDKTSLVLGSAVQAFEEVCPDRFDLIHLNFRKFATLMADFDEWGQVILINMLIRYGRTQFTDPVKSDNHILDSDHRMLLRNSKPLLQSRNAAVVMAVVQLHLTLGPSAETNVAIVKPLIRLLHSRPEIQSLVLTNIATMTSSKSLMLNQTSECGERIDNQIGLRILFEPYLKSFFVKARDSTQVKILKLEILTNLSTGANIALILREFQAYVQNYQDGDDAMDFISATIHAIGRCATRIKEVAPICLNGLISLLSNRNEAIVAQSIIVIRTQIINKEREKHADALINNSVDSNHSQPTEESNAKADNIITLIIKQVAKLLDKITTSQARATILWIVAEFCSKNAKAYQVAADVLRKCAKTFPSETGFVKLQIMSLAAKFYVANHPDFPINCERAEIDRERLKLLVNYVFALAKYDLNYDVRDRGRFLKQMLIEVDNDPIVGIKAASKILMTAKLDQINESVGHDTTNRQASLYYRVGTMSHFVGKRVSGYEPLPEYPEVQPDPKVRDRPEDLAPVNRGSTFELINKGMAKKIKKREPKFYSDDSSQEESDDEEDSDEESSEEDSSEEDSEEETSGSEEDSDEEDSDEEESSEADEESSGDEDEEESEEVDDDKPPEVVEEGSMKHQESYYEISGKIVETIPPEMSATLETPMEEVAETPVEPEAGDSVVIENPEAAKVEANEDEAKETPPTSTEASNLP